MKKEIKKDAIKITITGSDIFDVKQAFADFSDASALRSCLYHISDRLRRERKYGDGRKVTWEFVEQELSKIMNGYSFAEGIY